ncbi:phage adaptor protein [Methylobacterium organophilum]|uniref:Uncharacterized protein n=1 Tax=Methylobacterium organophilum TaxID=410 RepID=A0ABQ4TDP4_METOR|nr:hypothetical protein [Methylobacterium organophilum]GJE29806.1 hypothetical protein LKMONMHP_4692 [Methylobacterium organophilum]
MADLITDYDSLLATFENYVARPDLGEFFPNFVQAAEAFFNRKLRTRDMQGVANLSAVAGQPGSYALPADFLEWVGAQYTAASSRPLMLRYVEPDSPEFRHRYRPNGAPQYFTVFGDQLQTRSTQAGAVALTYYKRIDGLTSIKKTNFLITLAPELYLYAVMAESYRFQKDGDRSEFWSQKANEHLAALMGQADTAKTGRRPGRTAEDTAEALARNNAN